MPNEQYQALVRRHRGGRCAEALLDVPDATGRTAPRRAPRRARGRHRPRSYATSAATTSPTSSVPSGGRGRPDDRPTVIFAYTIKGYGLEIAGPAAEPLRAPHGRAGRPAPPGGRAHARDRVGRIRGRARARASCSRRRGSASTAGTRTDGAPFPVPATISERDPPSISTQAAFGRVLLDLSRVDGVAERLVTVVARRVGLDEPRRLHQQGRVSGARTRARSTTRWRTRRSSGASARAGQHIEMGIAEMNLVLLLGQLGLSWDFQRERLFPIGTRLRPVRDAGARGDRLLDVLRDPASCSSGTPSGISLSREGGAHQSISTPGIGIETPGLTYAEPCYARELEWLLLDALARMQRPTASRSTSGSRRRRSTRRRSPRPSSGVGVERLRADVVAGGFRLREPGPQRGSRRARGVRCDRARGARGGELLAEEEGVEATVLCLSSPDRLYRDWQRAARRAAAWRLVRRRRTSSGSSPPTSEACRSSP